MNNAMAAKTEMPGLPLREIKLQFLKIKQELTMPSSSWVLNICVDYSFPV